MSTIGKIFLFVNLALAAAFLGWAANSLGKSQELKKAHADAIEQATSARTKAESEASSARTQARQEEQAKDALRNERDNLDSRLKSAQQELEAEKRSNEQLRGDVAKINAAIGTLNTQLSAIEQAKDAAVAAAREAERERDAARDESQDSGEKQRAAEEARKQAEMEVASLEKQLKSTRDEVASLDTRLREMISVYGAVESAQKAIDARVVSVDYTLKPGLVALNVGKSQDVQPGYTFEIYAGNVYKGRVKVQSVYQDMCAAIISVQKDGVSITAGDSASTRL
jgi:chromosome segregation ATPase